jgi:hypothetical protein
MFVSDQKFRRINIFSIVILKPTTNINMSDNYTARRERVLAVMRALKPFSEDGGASAVPMQAFDFDDMQIVHELMGPWVAMRPCKGGKQFGYEAVVLPGDSRVSIISPSGKVYATLDNC